MASLLDTPVHGNFSSETTLPVLTHIFTHIDSVILPVGLSIFPNMIRMGKPPLPRAEAPFVPPVRISMDVPEISGIALAPGKDILPLTLLLALQLGADLLVRAIFARGKLL